MDARKIFIGIAVILMISGFLVFANKVMHAEDGSSFESAVSAKLDEIIKDQKTILQGISSIQGQLEVIRIRVTQNQ